MQNYKDAEKILNKLTNDKNFVLHKIEDQTLFVVRDERGNTTDSFMFFLIWKDKGDMFHKHSVEIPGDELDNIEKYYRDGVEKFTQYVNTLG